MTVFPETILSRRLQLRKPRASDSEAIFASYTQDPQVSRYMVWRPHGHVSQSREFISDCLAAWEGSDRVPYVLTYRDRDEPIGMLDARLQGHLADIGYVLARTEWGRGLMPEAIEALVREMYSREGIWRIQASCDHENVASRRTLEKSGFVCEGLLAAYTIHPNISPLPRACYMYARCRSHQ